MRSGTELNQFLRTFLYLHERVNYAVKFRTSNQKLSFETGRWDNIYDDGEKKMVFEQKRCW